MIIDCRLTLLKNYLSQGRLSKGGINASIDQSAVSASEQNNVALELDDGSSNSQDSYKKKQEDSSHSQDDVDEKVVKVVLSDTDNKVRNLKLLNLL